VPVAHLLNTQRPDGLSDFEKLLKGTERAGCSVLDRATDRSAAPASCMLRKDSVVLRLFVSLMKLLTIEPHTRRSHRSFEVLAQLLSAAAQELTRPPWKPSLRAYLTAFAADDAPIRASATEQHK
jgi:hypothetical protein